MVNCDLSSPSIHWRNSMMPHHLLLLLFGTCDNSGFSQSGILKEQVPRWTNYINRLQKMKYCWWTKSCNTNHDDYPIIYRVLYIPGGAGFRPSTVCWEIPGISPTTKSPHPEVRPSIGRCPLLGWCCLWNLYMASPLRWHGRRQLILSRNLKYQAGQPGWWSFFLWTAG